MVRQLILIMNHLCAYKVRGVGTAVSGRFSPGQFPSTHVIILGQLLSPHFSNPDNYPSIIFRPGQFFPIIFQTRTISSHRLLNPDNTPPVTFRTISLPSLPSLSTINSNMTYCLNNRIEIRRRFSVGVVSMLVIKHSG